MASEKAEYDAYLKDFKEKQDYQSYLASHPSNQGNSSEPKTSAIRAFGENALDSALMGYLPHVKAAGEELGELIAGTDERSYIDRRDQKIKELQAMKQEHPVASGLGTGAGILAQVIGTGGAGLAARGGAKAAIGVGARLSSAAKTGAVLGALQNPGDTIGKGDPLQLEDRAKNAAIGYGLGAAGQVLAEGAGAVASKASEALRNKASAKAARAVGRPTPTQARMMAKSGDDIALGRELLDQGAIPVLGTPGRIANKIDDLKEKAWSKVEKILSRGGDSAVVDGAEAGMRILNSEELGLLREAGETQAVKSLEDAAEQLAGMGSLTLDKAQKIKRTIDKQINYNKPIPDMTGGQAARVSKRSALRDQMDQAVTNLGGEKGELKGAFKKYGLLEKGSEIAEREAGRAQANRAVSLTDSIAGAAGMARGEPMTAVALAAANKFGRTFGNSIQARSYDGIAKQLAKIPELSQIAESNPRGFAVLVERVAERLRAEPSAVSQFADSGVSRDVAEAPALKGEALWTQNGLNKLQIQDQTLSDQLLNSKEGRRLLIEASDLPQSSKRFQAIKNQILQGKVK